MRPRSNEECEEWITPKTSINKKNDMIDTYVKIMLFIVKPYMYILLIKVASYMNIAVSPFGLPAARLGWAGLVRLSPIYVDVSGRNSNALLLASLSIQGHFLHHHINSSDSNYLYHYDYHYNVVGKFLMEF